MGGWPFTPKHEPQTASNWRLWVPDEGPVNRLRPSWHGHSRWRGGPPPAVERVELVTGAAPVEDEQAPAEPDVVTRAERDRVFTRLLAWVGQRAPDYTLAELADLCGTTTAAVGCAVALGEAVKVFAIKRVGPEPQVCRYEHRPLSPATASTSTRPAQQTELEHGWCAAGRHPRTFGQGGTVYVSPSGHERCRRCHAEARKRQRSAQRARLSR